MHKATAIGSWVLWGVGFEGNPLPALCPWDSTAELDPNIMRKCLPCLCQLLPFPYPSYYYSPLGGWWSQDQQQQWFHSPLGPLTSSSISNRSPALFPSSPMPGPLVPWHLLFPEVWFSSQHSSHAHSPLFSHCFQVETAGFQAKKGLWFVLFGQLLDAQYGPNKYLFNWVINP